MPDLKDLMLIMAIDDAYEEYEREVEKEQDSYYSSDDSNDDDEEGWE